MTLIAVDKSFGSLDGRDLYIAGIVGGIGYFAQSEDSGKRLTRAEAYSLSRWGRDIAMVYEDGTETWPLTRSGGGKAAGKYAGDRILIQAEDIQMPADKSVFIAVGDYDAPASDLPILLDVVAGAADRITGFADAGGYGGYRTVKYLHEQGVPLTWQTSAWSSLTCQLGDHDDGVETWVAQLQALLGISVTGEYDTATKTAVAKWQGAHGLSADGVAGPKTWRSLGRDGIRWHPAAVLQQFDYNYYPNNCDVNCDRNRIKAPYWGQWRLPTSVVGLPPLGGGDAVPDYQPAPMPPANPRLTHMEDDVLDASDPVVVAINKQLADLTNRLGAVQYGVVPDGGFVTQGEITRNVRDIRSKPGFDYAAMAAAMAKAVVGQIVIPPAASADEVATAVAAKILAEMPLQPATAGATPDQIADEFAARLAQSARLAQ